MADTTRLIRELREKSGATQAEVAKELGMARATYAALEDSREPKLSELQKIAEMYSISVSELVEGKLVEDGETADLAFENLGIVPGDFERDLNPELNAEKLREVLLYLTNKVGAKANVGETVLYKLLYFIDFDFYEKTGRSITGLTYKKLAFGPVPVQRSFSGVVSEMEKNDDLEIVETEYFSHQQKKYLPKRSFSELKNSLLTAQELNHINWEIDRLSDRTATSLSDFSHQDTPWIVAQVNEPLSYQYVFYRTPVTAVTEDEDEL